MSYREAIEAAFGSEVVCAQLLKEHGTMPSEDGSRTARRYSPNVVTSVETRVVPHVARRAQQPSMRMGMRRFTRLTNAFSEKVENLAAAVALHFMHYNFARPHQSLGKNTTPAMVAGLSDHVWTCPEVAALLD